MELLYLVLLLAIVGFLVYLVITYIPMPEAFKTAIVVIVVIALVVYCARLLFGGSLPALRLP